MNKQFSNFQLEDKVSLNLEEKRVVGKGIDGSLIK